MDKKDKDFMGEAGAMRIVGRIIFKMFRIFYGCFIFYFLPYMSLFLPYISEGMRVNKVATETTTTAWKSLSA